jgi:hypothetical protein
MQTITDSEIIVNRVAQSGIITLDLEKYYPETNIVSFDLKDFLFMGMILKEKEFRAALKEHNWETYQQQYVAIVCSADAIVPMWANMLVAAYLTPIAKRFVFGSPDTLLTLLYAEALSQIDLETYRNKRVVIKGCGSKTIPEAAYTEITRLLQPLVKSLMYGEPCSTVPIYKATV